MLAPTIPRPHRALVVVAALLAIAPATAVGSEPVAGSEPVPDPGSEPVPDPGSVPVPVPGSEPVPEPESVPGSEPVPGAGSEPVPDPGSEPVPDTGSVPVPGSEPVPEPEPVPESVPGSVPVPGVLAAPLLLPPDAVVVALALEARLDADRASLAPDLWVGIGDRLTLGLIHSHRPAGVVGDARGLCLSGCLPADDRYRGVALEAHFPLIDPDPTDPGAMQLVGVAATDLATFTPRRASFIVGALAAWHGGRWWAQAGPRLAVGLLDRAGGNREHTQVTVVVGATVVAPIALELGAGVGGPATTDFFARAAAPLWAQLVLRPFVRIGIGVAIGTSDSLGGPAQTGYAALTLAVRAR